MVRNKWWSLNQWASPSPWRGWLTFCNPRLASQMQMYQWLSDENGKVSFSETNMLSYLKMGHVFWESYLTYFSAVSKRHGKWYFKKYMNIEGTPVNFWLWRTAMPVSEKLGRMNLRRGKLWQTNGSPPRHVTFFWNQLYLIYLRKIWVLGRQCLLEYFWMSGALSKAE